MASSMLARLDLDLIFAASKTKGYLWADLYSEVSHHCQIQIQDRLEESRLVIQSGISFRAFDGKRVRLFSTNYGQTEDILRFIDGNPPSMAVPKTATAVEPGLPALPEATKQKTAKIAQLARALWSESQEIDNPGLLYEDRFKRFEVADQHGVRAQGTEEFAGLNAQWGIERDGRRIPYRLDRYRNSVTDLIGEIDASDKLRQTVQNSLSLANPWPSPSGKLPIHWGPRAFAKLAFQFLRGFEGDLFLRSQSFLTEFAKPLPLHFSIQDLPAGTASPFDNEGSPRKPVILFDQGKPRALACNNWIAEQLAVPSTGHCRRESYRSTPTVGFWSPRIVGHNRVPDALKTMKWGITVDDIEILRFDPVTADISLTLNEVALIHHGEKGEVVEPIALKINLLTLLESFRVFTEKTATAGIPLFKQGQQILTEVSAPAVAAEPILIAGQVPLSHYW